MVTGVSLGALNAYILATHKPTEKEQTIETLKKFWTDFAKIEPYKAWPGGFLYGFFFEKGIYDLSPAAEYIYTRLGYLDTVHTHLNIALTDILDGKFTIFDESWSTDDLRKILVASVSFSGVSPAVEWDGQYYFSGDSVYENDVLSVINHCESLGYEEKDIVIDTVLSGQRDIEYYDHTESNAFDVLQRASKIFKYY